MTWYPGKGKFHNTTEETEDEHFVTWRDVALYVWTEEGTQICLGIIWDYSKKKKITAILDLQQ